MLLPYYIASMNIEHEHYERTGEYKPFEGICLVDTFELAEDKQLSFMFTQENTERVEKLRKTKLFVIIGNPPYNARQVNENDNNKNRKYKTMDRRVAETYSRDSTATNKNALSDPYVKAIRWAADKIVDNGEGIVAFVSNNSFVGDYAFDGMRRHLLQDFTDVYVVDLKGNIRKDSMRDGVPLGEKHTVFGLSAMVGICISFFVRRRATAERRVIHAETDFRATRLEKFQLLENAGHVYHLPSRQMKPDKKYTWLTDELQPDFDNLIPMGSRETKAGVGEALFRVFTPGVKTNRDQWAYNFDARELARNITRTIDTYNDHVAKWSRMAEKPQLDDFVLKDDKRISWSRDLKLDVTKGKVADFSEIRIRKCIYRPFVKSCLYFDRMINEEVYRFPQVFPIEVAEIENHVICLTDKGSEKPFVVMMTNHVTDLHLVGAGSSSQCFPFYEYDDDGTNRRENITDWAVEQFKSAMNVEVDKWQIFHYVYGLLHSQEYREKYKANLKRELPRIPLPKSIEEFRSFVSAGERLADLHVNYEAQPEYPLEKIETPEQPLNWRVEKMKLTKDKSAIVYNDFLTLSGIPPEVFDYRLGNRSALEWIIDRYQVRTDKRSGIVNDPNRPDDPQYIVRLIGKIITVSLETMKIVDSLPGLE
jgi:predicted helicase